VFTDDDRRALYEALETALGHEPAAILMGHLPPVGWADLATRGDLAELRGEVRSLLPKLIAANIGSMIGVAGLVLAATALAR
jgi:hypothetical protein